ncbi:MAG TPA: hypothetical protein VNA29_08415 [Sphingomicrobium sp.]|nr:hypothetical protein [Sphingomicrobium sp.]
MSRTLFLSMDESEVVNRCAAASVGISAIEALPGAGVRLVCMSVDGAELMRSKLRSRIIKGAVERHRIRPSRPLW